MSLCPNNPLKSIIHSNHLFLGPLLKGAISYTHAKKKKNYIEAIEFLLYSIRGYTTFPYEHHLSQEDLKGFHHVTAIN